ncbi:hypothetical protein KJE20_09190 [Pyrenophora tritici-repentis]|nr:hypothetical protein Ptr86124_011728 [Pyrenophora tritici-repentis]KAI1680339.1 hypothetical protein KJE20_09190 [Pyrenophora tritici-repentis]
MPWIGGDIPNGSPLTDISASIISANPTATTVSLKCAAPTVDCGLFPAEVYVFGPSTYNINMGDPSPEADFTGTMDCVIAKSAVCKESASGTEANFPGSSTETYDADDVATVGLVVTAGLEKLDFKVEASTTVDGKSSATSTAVGGSAGSMSSAQLPASTSVSVTGSAATPAATGAAVVNTVGGGLLSIAAGLLGGLLL